MFAALAVWAFLPLAILFVRAGAGGISFDTDRGVFNGSAGLQVADHLQYLAWIRDAGEHVLFANRFDVANDPHLFFHPGFALSGLAWRLGASLQVAALMWKPITLVAVFLGFAAYVRRLLPDYRIGQAAALVLALFFVSPAMPLLDWLGIGSDNLQYGTQVMGLEMFPGGYLWGGFPGVLSVAAMPLFLLGVERILEPSRRAAGRSTRRYALWTGLAGLVASWFHPWQGLILLVIVAGLVIWDRFDRRYLALAVPVLLTIAPLGYLFVLSHTDSSWEIASAYHPNYVHVGLWLFLGLAPALLALPGLRGCDLDLQERALRLWPAAALLVYFGLRQSWFYHAFVGVSLPLAILAVRGWHRLRLPRAVAVITIAALTVPGMAWTVQQLVHGRADHFFTNDEGDALVYLERSPRPGAVLAPLWLGQAVPAFADRNTWLGHYTWTPDYGTRLQQAEALFGGRMSASQARKLVRNAGVAFVATDCRDQANLTKLLGPLVAQVRHFGCATVYDMRSST